MLARDGQGGRGGGPRQRLTLRLPRAPARQLRERVAGEVRLQSELMAIQGMLQPMLVASLAAAAAQ